VRQPFYTTAFRRDLRRLERRHKDMAGVVQLIELLVTGASLPVSYRDHPLKGEWLGFRDAHIEGDWVLIYRVDGDRIEFNRTGTHADLFGT
jgi:mRNA interferase YafQ